MITARLFVVSLFASLLLTLAPAAGAAELLMARSMQAFPEAMLTLQDALNQHGYTISRVQRVDLGLKKAGFKTAKYRVVFFGKPKQIDRLASRYPDLIPYLPLKIAIFAERNNTLVVASNPMELATFFHHPKLKPVFKRWTHDLQAVFDEMRTTTN